MSSLGGRLLWMHVCGNSVSFSHRRRKCRVSVRFCYGFRLTAWASSHSTSKYGIVTSRRFRFPLRIPLRINEYTLCTFGEVKDKTGAISIESCACACALIWSGLLALLHRPGQACLHPPSEAFPMGVSS